MQTLIKVPEKIKDFLKNDTTPLIEKDGVLWYNILNELYGGVDVAIQESGEMYLETIRILSSEGKPVRAIDICEHMGYSKPSVSRAMKILKDKELMAHYKCVDVTDMPMHVFSNTKDFNDAAQLVMRTLGMIENTTPDQEIEDAKN